MTSFGDMKATEAQRNAARLAKRERQKQNLIEAAARRPLRIVIGASGHFESGWTPTDVQLLNLLEPRQWAEYLAEASVDAMLAEHVWEHLSIDDGIIAARTCHRFLCPGGYLRVAVPDGLHPDPAYIEWVKPGGVGVGSDEHRILYTHQTFAAVFAAVGFEVRLLEHWDARKKFHFVNWDPEHGKIERSRRFDERNAGGELNYTSLILDAVKR